VWLHSCVNQLLSSVLTSGKMALDCKEWPGDEGGTSYFPEEPGLANGNDGSVIPMLCKSTSSACRDQ
jgi:hypothetical protein